MHVNAYLKFCSDHDVVALSPSVYDLLSFLLFLSDKLRSPRAVSNYFCSVKLWITSANSGLDTYEVKLMKKALIKNSRHTVSHAPALGPEEF